MTDGGEFERCLTLLCYESRCITFLLLGDDRLLPFGSLMRKANTAESEDASVSRILGRFRLHLRRPTAARATNTIKNPAGPPPEAEQAQPEEVVTESWS